ncbi:hypothetical protein KY289_023509 [Solanum tuberosum]|nr:hypothetical protein KY289_023509 [Solanum tuberosum]
MREGARNKDGSSFAEDLLGDTEPTFDRTPDIGVPLSSDSEDDKEDNTPICWAIQRRMVSVTKKGKEKVVEDTPKRKPSTRGATHKLMSDAMKANKSSTTEI